MRNKTYEIVYVLKDNHKDSIEGFSLFVRRYKAKNIEQAKNKFQKSKFYEPRIDYASLINTNGSNIRSIYQVKGEKWIQNV